MRKGDTGKKSIVQTPPVKQEESTNMILNRLISGSSIKRKRNKII